MKLGIKYSSREWAFGFQRSKVKVIAKPNAQIMHFCGGGIHFDGMASRARGWLV